MGDPIVLPAPADLSAPSATVVWALYGEFNGLFRSTDQGKTWQRRPVPKGVNRAFFGASFSFVDDHEGWLLVPGQPASQCGSQPGTVVWYTIDAGTTWQMLPLVGVTDFQCKRHISFVDANHGYLSASDQNNRPTIWETRDGGLTWEGARLPDPPGFTSTGAGFVLMPGQVHAANGVLLVTASGRQDGASPFDRWYIFQSTDQGRSWSYVAKAPTVADAIAFPTASRWVILLPNAIETTDAGISWHPMNTDYGQAAPVFPQVLFATSSVGYATVRGEIQRTVDGGAHWEFTRSPAT